MQVMQYEFHLFGPNKNRSMSVNGHQFKDGVCQKVVTPMQAVPLIRVLSFYGAYAKGTPEYDRAVLAEQEEANGTSDVHSEAEQGGPASVQCEVQSDGSGSSALQADNGSGAVDSSSNGSGSDSDRDGYTDSGIPKFEEPNSHRSPVEPSSVGDDAVKVAILKLDPENSDHWVQTGVHKGKPKLSAVEDAYGKSGLTRQDLEDVLPDWSRDKALEHALNG